MRGLFRLLDLRPVGSRCVTWVFERAGLTCWMRGACRFDTMMDGGRCVIVLGWIAFGSGGLTLLWRERVVDQVVYIRILEEYCYTCN